VEQRIDLSSVTHKGGWVGPSQIQQDVCTL